MIASIPSPPFDVVEIGPLNLRLYGLMIALGALAAVEIGRARWAARGHDPEQVVNIAKWAIPAGLVGARIYHVLTDWRSYQGRWLDAFKIWEGGLGIPGGLALGVAVGVWVARRQGLDLRRVTDAVVPGIPVAQAIGRLGNWFNQELYGGPTDLPWGLEIDEDHRPARFLDQATFHPTFLYEALWNLLLAALLIALDRRRVLKPGQILPLWVLGYGIGRFLVESVRIDPASLIWGVRVNHWMSAIAVVGGAIGFWWAGRTAAADVDRSDPDAAGDRGPRLRDDQSSEGPASGGPAPDPASSG